MVCLNHARRVRGLTIVGAEQGLERGYSPVDRYATGQMVYCRVEVSLGFSLGKD